MWVQAMDMGRTLATFVARVSLAVEGRKTAELYEREEGVDSGD
jgi:hypothetical protein